MKANELSCKDLMIGDWVYNTHNQQNERVQEIGSRFVMLDYNDLYEYDEIEPIPITPEILEKNGFKWTTHKSYMVSCIGTVRMIWGFYKDCLSVSDHSDDGDCQISSLKCKFVHKLQNTIRICGINHEIIL